jgi:hypothetical protein
MLSVSTFSKALSINVKASGDDSGLVFHIPGELQYCVMIIEQPWWGCRSSYDRLGSFELDQQPRLKASPILFTIVVEGLFRRVHLNICSAKHDLNPVHQILELVATDTGTKEK